MERYVHHPKITICKNNKLQGKNNSLRNLIKNDKITIEIK